MNQIDAATRQALCRGDQPPPGVEDRILAAILPPILPPGGPPGEPSGGSPGGSTGSWGLDSAATGGSSAAAGGAGLGVAAHGGLTLTYALQVVAATLGLAAAGVGLLAVTAQGVRALTDSGADPSTQDRAAVVAPVTNAPATDPSRLPAASDPLASSDPDASEPEPPPELSHVRPAPSAATAAAKKSASTGPASPPGVEAELALIQRARTTRDPEATLALLTQHAERFPDGVFAAEREVLRVEQLCALGRRSEAETIAASFLARRSQHPLRARIQPACRE
jgi:hypothetical protein